MIVLDSNLFCIHVKAVTANIFVQLGKVSSCIYFAVQSGSLVMYATDGMTVNKAKLSYAGEAKFTEKAVGTYWLLETCKHLPKEKGSTVSLDFDGETLFKIKAGTLEFVTPFSTIQPPPFSDIFKE